MLLAIDTCGPAGGVAIGDFAPDEKSLLHDRPQVGFRNLDRFTILDERELAGKTFSELLLSTIAEMLWAADVGREQVDGVVVVHGPGSFTGIRIGVSAAKGLAEGWVKPVIAVSRLELLARQCPDGSAAVALDAGRGEFYFGLYREGVQQAEVLLTRELLTQAVVEPGVPLLVCEQRVFETLAGLGPRLVSAPGAAAALRLGARRFLEGIWDDVVTLDGNYLRRSESEMLARIAEHEAYRSSKPPILGAKDSLE